MVAAERGSRRAMVSETIADPDGQIIFGNVAGRQSEEDIVFFFLRHRGRSCMIAMIPPAWLIDS